MESSKEILKKEWWNRIDKLRKGEDIWEFRKYILGLIFYRYISEDFEEYVNKGERDFGDLNFEYSKENDADWDNRDVREELIGGKGLFLFPSYLFKNILGNAKSEDGIRTLNSSLRSIFESIENNCSTIGGESWFKQLFKIIDVNSDRLGSSIIERNRRLIEIMGVIQQIPSQFIQEIYEHLIMMYSVQGGKAGASSYTFSDISELLALLAYLDQTSKLSKAYDPACGTGSLLLKFPKMFKDPNIELYGQEINPTNYNICKMNMILAGLNYTNIKIELGDTLISPRHKGQKFDAIVSNTPHSMKWIGDDDPILIHDERYSPAGMLASKNNCDYAFIMHGLYHLSNRGTMVMLKSLDILCRKRDEDLKIRKYLIENNFLDCVIKLAEGVNGKLKSVTCVMVFKKNKTNQNILFINAEDQFVKLGSSDRKKLSHNNIMWIMDKYKRRENIPYVSKLEDIREMKNYDYDLSINARVGVKVASEIINIVEVENNIAESVKNSNDIRKWIEDDLKRLKGWFDF